MLHFCEFRCQYILLNAECQLLDNCFTTELIYGICCKFQKCVFRIHNLGIQGFRPLP